VTPPVDREPSHADRPSNSRSAEVPGLRRDLGVVSLVLAQVVNIVGAAWCGTAAVAGEFHVVLWLASALLFFIPSAIVAGNLASLVPLEGGLYKWAEAGFGPLLGFLVGWNLLAYIIVSLASFGPLLSSSLSYLLGGPLGYAIDTPSGILCVSVLMLAACLASTSLGLRFGKWVHGFGAIASMAAFAAVMVLPLLATAHSTAEHSPAAITVSQVVTLLNMNVLSKMTVGAFGGIEYVAIMAGECKDPRRSIVRSVWIAAPLIVLMYVFGTNGVIHVVPRDTVDLIAPIPQALRIGLSSTGIALEVSSIMIAMLAIAQVGAACWQFAGASRLPMVAGWEGRAPAWMGVVSKRFRSPLRAALFLAAVVLALIALGETGVGRQEAFQLLNNACQVHYAIAYVAMFAIPLIGRRGLRARVSRAARFAAIPGLLTTLSYVGFALVPIVDVSSTLTFGLKIAGTICVINVCGLLSYLLLGSSDRQDSHRQPPAS
jgi:amino acid transporter